MPDEIRNPRIIQMPAASPGLKGFAWATVGVLCSLLAAFLLNRLLPHANLSLVFITGVLVVAARWGLGPSLYAGLMSFLAFNFFFTPPYHTFIVNDDGDVATLLFFLLMAALTGKLAARMHDEMAKNQEGLLRITTLYAFARRMTAAADSDSILRQLTEHLSSLLETSVLALLPDAEGKLVVRSGFPRETAFSLPLERLSAAWRIDAPPPISPGLIYFTLGTARGPVGLVAIQRETLQHAQEELVRALCDQAAIAIERTALVADLETARLVSEREQLRSALLSSVSHDLRTPLASIIGSTSTLLEYGTQLSRKDSRDLLHNVLGEAERLNRYIQNLLDMTRLGQGGLSLDRDWTAFEDILGSALHRLDSALAEIKLSVDLPETLPLLYVHGALIEQALVNLLDNAIRFSPAGGGIRVQAAVEDGRMLIDVIDQGPGIPEGERERIFEMFYSISGSDRRLQGTGLGLAICRGLIGAHGGEVIALEGPEGVGTCMRIALPLQAPESS